MTSDWRGCVSGVGVKRRRRVLRSLDMTGARHFCPAHGLVGATDDFLRFLDRAATGESDARAEPKADPRAVVVFDARGDDCGSRREAPSIARIH